MKGVDTLIRLHKSELDERRRQVRALEAELDQLHQAVARLDQALADEQAVVAEGELVLHDRFLPFAEDVARRRADLEVAIAQQISRIEAAQDEVAEAFRELKKYEVTKEHRQAEEAQIEAARQQGALDEMGLNIHRRGRDRG